MKHPAIFIIRFYQYALRGFFFGVVGTRSVCRFYPSCSDYSITALENHGFLRGGILSAKRIARCRPGGGAGYDPTTAPARLIDK